METWEVTLDLSCLTAQRVFLVRTRALTLVLCLRSPLDSTFLSTCKFCVTQVYFNQRRSFIWAFRFFYNIESNDIKRVIFSFFTRFVTESNQMNHKASA